MSRDAGPEPHLSHVSLFYTLKLVHNYVLEGNRAYVSVGVAQIVQLYHLTAEEVLEVYLRYYYDYAQARDLLDGPADNDN